MPWRRVQTLILEFDVHSKYLKENGEELDLPDEPGQQVKAGDDGKNKMALV